jgi:hypothetical protein
VDLDIAVHRCLPDATASSELRVELSGKLGDGSLKASRDGVEMALVRCDETCVTFCFESFGKSENAGCGRHSAQF